MAFCADARWPACVLHASIALSLIACGGSPPPDAETPTQEGEAGSAASHSRPSGIGVESEVGALDERKVKETFERVSPKLIACFHKGAEKIPFLAGEVRFLIRVAPDGRARWAYPKDSTLGDRDTEQCMLSELKAATWPKPVGGQEGLAENGFSFDPGDGERPPVAWSPEQLGKPLEQARAALSRCRTGAGTGPLKVTLYVQTDGRPISVGASASDEKAESAISCVVDTLKAVKFPSPGSYASKVTLQID